MLTSPNFKSLPPPSRRLLLLLVALIAAVFVTLYLMALPLMRSVPAEVIPGATGVTATWLPDSANAGGLTIHDAVALNARGAFVPMPSPETVPVLNATKLDGRWFRFSIKGRAPRANSVILDLVWRNYDKATLYQGSPDFQSTVVERFTGENIVPSDSNRSNREMAFEVRLQPEAETVVYLHVQDYTRLPTQFQLWPQRNDFLKWEKLEVAKSSAFMCLLGALAVFALFNHATLHQRDQLHFLIIVAVQLVIQLLMNPGGLFIYGPVSPYREILIGSLGGIAAIFNCQFARRFLDLEREDSFADSVMIRLKWFVFGGIVLLPLTFWPGTAFVNLMLVFLLHLIVLSTLIWVGIRRWRTGVKRAAFYVLAQSVQLLGLVQFLVKGPDILERYDEQLLISMFCNSFALVMLAMAASYRHRGVLQDHLNLQKGYLDRLEREVAERTRVLKQLTDRLAATVGERDRILAIIGHDLRGPASSLQSLTDILAKDVRSFTSEELSELSREISQVCSLQLELLNNLLVWGSAQAGHGGNAVSISVREAAAAAWKPLASMAVEKNIMLADACPADVRVFAESSLVQTVLRNLFANAIKFTEPGGRIEIGCVARADRMIEILVKDDGVGIAPERLGMLFSGPTESSLGTYSEKGAGLGLSLCRDLARSAGGDIKLESEIGRGTRAIFTLPRATE